MLLYKKLISSAGASDCWELRDWEDNVPLVPSVTRVIIHFADANIFNGIAVGSLLNGTYVLRGKNFTLNG